LAILWAHGAIEDSRRCSKGPTHHESNLITLLHAQLQTSILPHNSLDGPSWPLEETWGSGTVSCPVMPPCRTYPEPLFATGAAPSVQMHTLLTRLRWNLHAFFCGMSSSQRKVLSATCLICGRSQDCGRYPGCAGLAPRSGHLSLVILDEEREDVDNAVVKIGCLSPLLLQSICSNY
jgi:hypothetical protein